MKRNMPKMRPAGSTWAVAKTATQARRRDATARDSSDQLYDFRGRHELGLLG